MQEERNTKFWSGNHNVGDDFAEWGVVDDDNIKIALNGVVC